MASTLRSHHPLVHPALVSAALLALAGAASAQDTQSVQVTGHGPAESAGVTGFGQPLARTPLQAEVIDTKTLADIGAVSLSDLTRIDASLTDAYNAIGYWTTFSVRGFQVDNRYNFRRDGLPINAETALPLENKSGIEVLKGLSGMQAGTSAPGGLVNLIVKRPDADLRSASLAWSQDGSVAAAVDLSQRFGADRQFGARLNVSAAHLDPNVRDAKGHRQTASIATDWRIDRDHLLEFEFEHSLQSQPSVPGFSMLGEVLPDPHSIDPRLNLNDQPWSLPVVMQGNTMSLRYTQALAASWKLRVHALQQQLVSNDHLAFDYGLYDPDTYDCDPCDRFSSDGRYSIWDFRSDDERRRTRVLDLSLSGEFATGAVRHSLTVGALESLFTARFQDEAYNLVGVGTIDGRTIVPADPSLTSPNVNRTERSTELYARDAVQLAQGTTAWLGVRHSRLHRQTAETATGTPDDDTDYHAAFTTPWLALSQSLGAQDMVYLSWGEGIESNVAPTVGDIANHGQPLSPTISRQWEAGWKHGSGMDHWGVDVFDIEQAFDDTVTSADGSTSVFAHDGTTRARGLEAEAQARFDALTLRASAMWQRVKREGALDPSLDGLRPTNVPDSAIKLLANWAVADVPGLSLLGNIAWEGSRDVLPDDSVRIPAWTSVDLGLRYAQNLRGTSLVWRAGVNNVADARAWREAPYQYGHVYLFPLEARTFFASVEATF